MKKIKKKVLAVDDEKYLTDLIVSFLEKDYEVYAANDGRIARALFEAKKKEIDLIIMEMTMIKMSAIDIFLHFQKINPELKVIITIASFNREVSDFFSSKKECLGFVRKPFKLEYFLEKVKEAL